jgi:hypothetical protein
MLLLCIATLAIIQIIIVIELFKLPTWRQTSVGIFLQNDKANVDVQVGLSVRPIADKCQVLKGKSATLGILPTLYV